MNWHWSNWWVGNPRPQHNYLDKAAALALLGRTEEAHEAVRQFELVRPESWDMVNYVRAMSRTVRKTRRC